MAHPLVVHCKREAFDIYVGRPSVWGNPFHVTDESQRKQIIQRYRAWFLAQPALVERAKRELRGRRLGCWCAPKACHGDVLAEIANGA